MAAQYVIKCVEDCQWLSGLYTGPTMYTKNKKLALQFSRQTATEVAGILRFQSKMTKTYVLEDA